MKCWVFLALAACAAAQDQPVVVEGTVVDANTRAPLANATVSVRYTRPPDGNAKAAQQPQGASTLSGLDGRFRLEEFKTVPFRLSVERPGYVRQTASRVLNLKPGQSASGVILELAPESQLSGRVTDETLGQPLSGLTVRLQVPGDPAGRSTTTDEDGRFTLRSLPPGDYRLAVTPNQRPSLQPVTKSASAQRLAYPHTWFPGVSDPSGAMTISVPAGAQLSGFDFRLRQRPIVAVRGAVHLEGQASPVDLSLMLRMNFGSLELPLGALASPGDFEVTGLVPGSYVLCAANRVSDGTQQRRASIAFDLAAESLDGLQLNLLPGVPVDGEVRTFGHKDPKTDPLWRDKSGVDIKVGIFSALRGASRKQDPVAIGERGAFSIEGVPMEALALSLRGLSPGLIVISAEYNGTEVDPGWFHLNAAAATHHVTVYVGHPENSLQGTVKHGTNPIDQALVLLHREGPLDPLRTPVYLRATTDAAGHYSISTIRPGTYRALALELSEQAATARHRFEIGEGVKVTIGTSTQATANLEIK